MERVAQEIGLNNKNRWAFAQKTFKRNKYEVV